MAQITARTVRQQGRLPISSKRSSNGRWLLEVYRVGSRHEYQGLATCAHGDYQTRRIGAPGASVQAMADIEAYAERHVS